MRIIDFKLVTRDSDRLKMFNLRYKTCCLELNYFDPSGYPDELEYDRWDQYSLHFIATKKSRLAGTVRLIVEPPFEFPIEQVFNIKRAHLTAHRYAEVSRLIVVPEFRSVRFEVANGLYGIMYEHSCNNAITDWYATMEDKLARYYKRIGFKFHQLGEPKPSFGFINTPYILSLSETEQFLKNNNERLHESICKAQNNTKITISK